MKPHQKQKLELTWIGKGDEPKLEPRILIEQPELSYGDPSTGNMLIQGDNLLALKALEQDFAGKVKCIFIDPPYNTGSAFEHYDDGLEHSQWLNLMVPRLRILRELLSADGSIWVTIDDNEAHYLKVVMDEIFGRRNFVANVVWQKKYAVANDHKTIAPMHDHILVFRKSDAWQRNLLPRSDEKNRQYRLNDEKGRFRADNYTCGKTSDERPNLYYPIEQPNTGEIIWPKKTAVWRYSREEHQRHIAENMIYWGKDGLGKVPAYKRYLHLLRNDGIIPQSLWSHDFAGHTDGARKEARQVLGTQSLADDFITPKPEKLIQAILIIATSNSNDLVLDSFLGSGTTAAVAHKMGRRYIGIELGDHARTHCQPRLKKVVDGSDQGGISKAVGWQGGGGFRFYTLAPSLLNKDRYGHWVISGEYNPDMLAAAMAKQEGFRYQPDEAIYWKQARSSEKDFLFTTTAFLTAAMLDAIHDEMQTEESLLVACKAFQQECLNRHGNISIKKIPHMLLGRCEFGREDYSLNIVQVPVEEAPDDFVDEPGEHPGNAVPPRSVQTTLFD